MHSRTGQDDLWLEFEKRREDWRARRNARREAWRQHRAGFAQGCGGGLWGGYGPGAEADSVETNPVAGKVAALEATVATLLDRVAVLERIVVTDEARLAAEIERLRREEGGKS